MPREERAGCRGKTLLPLWALWSLRVGRMSIEATGFLAALVVLAPFVGGMLLGVAIGLSSKEKTR